MKLEIDPKLQRDLRLLTLCNRLEIDMPKCLGALVMLWLKAINCKDFTIKMSREQLDEYVQVPGFTDASYRIFLERVPGVGYRPQNIERMVIPEKYWPSHEARPDLLNMKWINIPSFVRGQWEKSYEIIDVEFELKSALRWVARSPRHEKDDYLSFLWRWLDRAERRASSEAAGTSVPRSPGLRGDTEE